MPISRQIKSQRNATELNENDFVPFNAAIFNSYVTKKGANGSSTAKAKEANRIINFLVNAFAGYGK